MKLTRVLLRRWISNRRTRKSRSMCSVFALLTLRKFFRSTTTSSWLVCADVCWIDVIWQRWCALCRNYRWHGCHCSISRKGRLWLLWYIRTGKGWMCSGANRSATSVIIIVIIITTSFLLRSWYWTIRWLHIWLGLLLIRTNNLHFYMMSMFILLICTRNFKLYLTLVLSQILLSCNDLLTQLLHLCSKRIQTLTQL